MLRFYSGSSNNVNSKKAIRECLGKALKDEPDPRCDLLIIYSSTGHNFRELISEARAISPEVRIAGCTVGGIINLNGPDESMKALAIMAIKGPADEFVISGRESAKGDPYSTAMEMTKELKSKVPGITMIQFLTVGTANGFCPVELALEGIKAVFGKKIPVFGGLSMMSMANLVSGSIRNFVFSDEQIFDDGAVMIGYADQTLKFINRANHGYEVLEGLTLQVTRSDTNIIYEINGMPAWEFITKTLGVPRSYTPMQINTISGFARTIPEDLWEENGSKYLLITLMAKNDDDSIVLPISFPEGKKFWLIKRDEKKMFEGIDLMMGKILNDLDRNDPVAVFQTDCLIRGRFSVDRILKEEITGKVQGPLLKYQNLPWLGFYAAGEFLMLGGEAMLQQFSSSITVLHR